MSITITDSNVSVTEPDQSAILVTGTGDTVTTNGSTITFNSGSGSALIVDGANDTISLSEYGETLTLGQNGVNAIISAYDGGSIHASGDELQLSFAANGGNSQHLSLDGNDNTVFLDANFTLGSSFTAIGDHNTVSAGFGLSSISIAGADEVVNVDNTFIGVSGSLGGRGSATINGSGDLINVFGADVSINGDRNTVFANDAAINLSQGGITKIIGGDNHVTADGVAITFNDAYSANTVDGVGDRISLAQYGETLTLGQNGVNAIISAYDGGSIHASGDELQLSFAANGGNSQHLSLDGNDNTVSLDVSFTALGSSFTAIGDHNTVSAAFGVSSISVAGTGEVVNVDDTFIGVSGSLAGAGSATINGNGDLINVFGAEVSINGDRNTVFANDTAINLSQGGISATIIGGDNHVTADNAFISLGIHSRARVRPALMAAGTLSLFTAPAWASASTVSAIPFLRAMPRSA